MFSDKMIRKTLGRYFSVMEDEKPAKFVISRKLSAEFDKKDSLKGLWQEHTGLTEEFYRLEREIDAGDKSFQELPTPDRSYLDLKIEIATRILEACHFCSRRCGVNRTKGMFGYCRCGSEIVVSSIFEHMGEEPELVPSGTVFTMGCTMRCNHCQNWTISQWIDNGETYKPKKLAKKIKHLRLSGCKNVNLVGGEPTPWLKHWLETFKHVSVNVPVVWNSNSYYSAETAQLLAGFVDVYLLDFKYGSDECAGRISDASNYLNVCIHNGLEAKKNGELIIRVLVLPNHLECCTKPIVNWIAENLGIETRVNLMFQYRPEWRAHEIPELHRRLTRDEMEKAVQLAREAKLANLTA
jgi:putative pyruvate formate lyase activating enzyme